MVRTEEKGDGKGGRAEEENQKRKSFQYLTSCQPHRVSSRQRMRRRQRTRRKRRRRRRTRRGGGGEQEER